MPIISVRFIDAATKINSSAPPDILQVHRLKNNACRSKHNAIGSANMFHPSLGSSTLAVVETALIATWFSSKDVFVQVPASLVFPGHVSFAAGG